MIYIEFAIKFIIWFFAGYLAHKVLIWAIFGGTTNAPQDPMEEAEANAPRYNHPATKSCACMHCYRESIADSTDRESGC
jgi:hypothetical protein